MDTLFPTREILGKVNNVFYTKKGAMDPQSIPGNLSAGAGDVGIVLKKNQNSPQIPRTYQRVCVILCLAGGSR